MTSFTADLDTYDRKTERLGLEKNGISYTLFYNKDGSIDFQNSSTDDGSGWRAMTQAEMLSIKAEATAAKRQAEGGPITKSGRATGNVEMNGWKVETDDDGRKTISVTDPKTGEEYVKQLSKDGKDAIYSRRTANGDLEQVPSMSNEIAGRFRVAEKHHNAEGTNNGSFDSVDLLDIANVSGLHSGRRFDKGSNRGYVAPESQASPAFMASPAAPAGIRPSSPRP